MNLKFSTLQSYKEFLLTAQSVNKSGVYVWGFCFVDTTTGARTEFKPYYAGKSEDNIYNRIQEHVEDIRTGTHTIMSSDTLFAESNYRNVKLKDALKVVYSNKVLRSERKLKNFPKSMLEPENQTELLPHINFYIDNLYVTYLEVNLQTFLGKEGITSLRKLERYVQDRLGKRSIAFLGKRYDDEFARKVSIEMGRGTEHLAHLFI